MSSSTLASRASPPDSTWKRYVRYAGDNLSVSHNRDLKYLHRLLELLPPILDPAQTASIVGKVSTTADPQTDQPRHRPFERIRILSPCVTPRLNTQTLAAWRWNTSGQASPRTRTPILERHPAGRRRARQGKPPISCKPSLTCGYWLSHPQTRTRAFSCRPMGCEALDADAQMNGNTSRRPGRHEGRLAESYCQVVPREQYLGGCLEDEC